MDFEDVLKKSKMIDIVQECSLKDYNNASAEFLKIINPKRNKIKSIYKVGSVSVLGISDLDYFLVFEDEKRDIYGKYHILNLSRKSRYIFLHNAFFVNEKVFKNLNLWFPFFNLKKVYGKDIKTNKQFNENICLILAVQYLINKIPSDLIFYSTNKNQFHQRTILAQINSLKHTLTLLKKAGMRISKKWLRFTINYDKFKSLWFKIESQKRERILKDFLEISIEISLDIIKEVDSYLTHKKRVKSKINNFELQLSNRKLYFAKDWNYDKALKLKGALLPISFGFYISLLAESKTNLGRQIKKKISKDIDFFCPVSLRESFTKHAKIIDEYNKFSKKKFRFPANGYHILWAPYYNNYFLNFIHKYFYKFLSLSYIL